MYYFKNTGMKSSEFNYLDDYKNALKMQFSGFLQKQNTKLEVNTNTTTTILLYTFVLISIMAAWLFFSKILLENQQYARTDLDINYQIKVLLLEYTTNILKFRVNYINLPLQFLQCKFVIIQRSLIASIGLSRFTAVANLVNIAQRSLYTRLKLDKY